jgi:hypothetical protein
VRVVAEGIEHLGDVLVHVGVEGHVVHEPVEFVLGRQLTLENQVGHLEERGPLGELLDGVSPVTQDSLSAIDEGDRAPGRGRVGEGRIVGHHPELVRADLDSPQVHGPDDVALQDLGFVLLARTIVADGQ